MINLLPPKEKEQLLLERNKKLLVVFGYIIIISLIYLALVLFSVKFYILGKMGLQKNILNNTEIKYQNSHLLSYNDLVKKHNANLVEAETFYKKQIYISDMIKTILDIQRPEGLSFNDMSVKYSEKDNKIKVTISGISDTRDNLLTFKDNMDNNEKIENIYFPPNSWIKIKDVNFYVTLEVLHDKK